MAKCEEGYRCEVCGGDVESLADSGLYLRFVLRLVDAESLHVAPERHLRCDPALAQFIVDGEFAPIFAAGDFDKRGLDPAFARAREALVTRAWRRLRALAGSGAPLSDYPLPREPL